MEKRQVGAAAVAALLMLGIGGCAPQPDDGMNEADRAYLRQKKEAEAEHEAQRGALREERRALERLRSDYQPTGIFAGEDPFANSSDEGEE